MLVCKASLAALSSLLLSKIFIEKNLFFFQTYAFVSVSHTEVVDFLLRTVSVSNW